MTSILRRPRGQNFINEQLTLKKCALSSTVQSSPVSKDQFISLNKGKISTVEGENYEQKRNQNHVRNCKLHKLLKVDSLAKK